MSASGVVLMCTLDERSPSRRSEARALENEIEALERAVAPAKLITAVRRDGPLLEVAVLAASSIRKSKHIHSSARPAGGSVTAWRPNPW